MPRDSICQRSGRVAGTGVDDHSGGFVYDGEIFVLKNYVERYILRLKNGGRGFDQVNVDLVAVAQPVRGLGLFFIDQHIAVSDQPLQPRTRPPLDALAQKCIEPGAGLAVGNLDSVDLFSQN